VNSTKDSYNLQITVTDSLINNTFKKKTGKENDLEKIVPQTMPCTLKRQINKRVYIWYRGTHLASRIKEELKVNRYEIERFYIEIDHQSK